jgi:hypothetical protein
MEPGISIGLPRGSLTLSVPKDIIFICHVTLCSSWLLFFFFVKCYTNLQYDGRSFKAGRSLGMIPVPQGVLSIDESSSGEERVPLLTCTAKTAAGEPAASSPLALLSTDRLSPSLTGVCDAFDVPSTALAIVFALSAGVYKSPMAGMSLPLRDSKRLLRVTIKSSTARPRAIMAVITWEAKKLLPLNASLWVAEVVLIFTLSLIN